MSEANSIDRPVGQITRCPKCGGTGGFEGVLVMRYDMAGEWGKPWQTTGSDRAIYRSQSVKCVDCGRRVDTNIAEGYEQPNTVNERPNGTA